MLNIGVIDSELIGNEVILSGVIVESPKFTDEYCRGRYEYLVSVSRFSGKRDIIPVCIFEDQLEKLNFKLEKGCRVRILGKCRSYNVCKNGKGKLFVRVLTTSITKEPDSSRDINSIKLDGYICKNAGVRITPFCRIITDLIVAVNWRSKNSSYIPCIVWDLTEAECERLKVGTHVQFVGRIQSRDYTKINDIGESNVFTTYELSVSKKDILLC